MSDLVFTINGESSSATQFKANARQFELVVDEPKELGGTDEAANPVEYLLAGFAGCLNVVAHLVAKELEFTIERLKIEISGSLNPNRFLGISKDQRAGFNAINVSLVPQTTADSSLLEQWLTLVEDRCPVKDNIFNQTPIQIDLKKSNIEVFS